MEIASRRSIEAVACVMKYFVAASGDRGFFWFISNGMMASRPISKPTHIRRRFELNIVIRGPDSKVR